MSVFGRFCCLGGFSVMVKCLNNFSHGTDYPCRIQPDCDGEMQSIELPDNLVQYVARDLLRRAAIITAPMAQVREISAAPLPLSELRAQYGKTPLEQWRMVHHARADKFASSVWRKLNPFAVHDVPQEVAWTDWPTPLKNTARASMVLAPLVLDGLADGSTDDVLTRLAELPQWFAPDGVLLFATLGAGAWPELVNRDEAWLAFVQHLPTIMDMGRRLQDLRFGLPVLDVETVRLGYTDADTLWQDMRGFSPRLRALSADEQARWRARLDDAFADGLRELSLEVIYGQVWQPMATPADNGVRTVSLESLTASLNPRQPS